MCDSHIEAIVSNLKGGSMFEYGSGGSTIMYSKYVDRYVSVEHDRSWYNLMTKSVQPHVKLLLRTPNGKRIAPFGPGNPLTQQSYIKSIHDDTAKYDHVLIDGRCRVDCARECVSHCTKDTLIYVHDYERTKYHEISNFLRLKELLIDKDDHRHLAIFTI